MRDLFEMRDERTAKIYGKPTPAQLARAAAKFARPCKKLTESASATIDRGEFFKDFSRFMDVCESLDQAAADLRDVAKSSGLGDGDTTEQSLLENMIEDLDRRIAELPDESTPKQLVVAVSHFVKPCEAFGDCADAANRRGDVIARRLMEAYKVDCKYSEKFWKGVRRCHKVL